MKTTLIDLLNIINYNIDYIQPKYPEIDKIIFEINELLNYNATDNQIVEWMLLNIKSIKIINECVENNTNFFQNN